MSHLYDHCGRIDCELCHSYHMGIRAARLSLIDHPRRGHALGACPCPECNVVRKMVAAITADETRAPTPIPTPPLTGKYAALARELVKARGEVTHRA